MKIKLFCFPYAGGFSNLYHSWRPLLSNDRIELHPVDVRPFSVLQQEATAALPATVAELVEDVYARIAPLLDEGLYAFFGYSLGGLIAYEITCKRLRDGNSLPEHLMLAASRMPISYQKLEKTYHLPQAEFVEKLREMGGTPTAVLEDEELLDLFLPLIRADFQAAQTYEQSEEAPVQLPVNMTVLYGTEDIITQEDLFGWNDFCAKNCRFFPIHGGHFFIHTQLSNVVELVEQILVSQRGVLQN